MGKEVIIAISSKGIPVQTVEQPLEMLFEASQAIVYKTYYKPQSLSFSRTVMLGII